MKRYKYEDWDFKWSGERRMGTNFVGRLYIDNDGNPITGILEGFYCCKGTTNTRDPKNCQYVENGKPKFILLGRV